MSDTTDNRPTREELRAAKISAARRADPEKFSKIAKDAETRKSPEAKERSLANLHASMRVQIIRDIDGNILCSCGCGGQVKPLRKGRPQYTIPGHIRKNKPRTVD